MEKIDGGTYKRALTISGHDVLLSIQSAGTIKRPRLILELFGDNLDTAIVEPAAAIVRRTFMLDVDPAPFLEAAQADPVLAQVVARHYQMRPMMIIDPFEALLWTVVGQQINMSFARRLKLALIEMCGRHMMVGGDRFALFPGPREVAMLEESMMRQRQFSRQKAAYVKCIAAAALSGQLDFDVLRSLPAEQALAALTSIRGIGRWTAEYIMIRALGFRDAIPAADVGLRKAVGLAYAIGRHATEEEVRAISSKWPGWRGWGAFYLWLDRLLKRTSDLTSAVQTNS